MFENRLDLHTHAELVHVRGVPLVTPEPLEAFGYYEGRLGQLHGRCGRILAPCNSTITLFFDDVAVPSVLICSPGDGR